MDTEKNMDEFQSTQDQPITSVNAGELIYFRKHPLWIVIPAIVFVAIVGYVIYRSGVADMELLIEEFVFVLAICFLPSLIIVRQRVQDEFMHQFAEANGYTFSPYGGNFGMLDGALFRLGNSDSRSVRNVVSGTYLGNPIALFDYSYKIDMGENRQIHYYTVFQLQFDAAMPDLLLEKKNFLSSDILLGQLPEHIKLEGDFNKYFSLSVKKGYEVEALELFTPDVMEELEEKCKNLSIEIINNHLFIYDNKTIRTKADLDALYDIAQYFVQKLGPVLARMKGSVETMDPSAQ
jgi:hypothetical protein